ncbi:MAG: hypothetical protein HYS26_04280 [Candidatus Kaiserbacteria bacterium]|nr:MAG: hypothetical protein HYS26_04280 [Candidatus Kaiserbacteria bacterium]
MKRTKRTGFISGRMIDGGWTVVLTAGVVAAVVAGFGIAEQRWDPVLVGAVLLGVSVLFAMRSLVNLLSGWYADATMMAWISAFLAFLAAVSFAPWGQATATPPENVSLLFGFAMALFAWFNGSTDFPREITLRRRRRRAA